MSNTKSTKRALLSSVMAIVLCLAMLIGTTFAWFTDSASTGVNKIQAGNLDVALEMKDNNGNWVSAEGKTLNFLQKQANGTVTQGTNILWEPGCTYELPELRVVNNGNLALKYKVIITGIAGDAKLNEAIEWTMVLDGNTYNIADEHELAAKTDAGIDFDVLTIKGHMKEDAGNEYQGLSIDGISITVIATQLNSENDSFGSDYDGRAEYNKKNVTIMADDGKTITLENSKTYTVGNGTVVVAANGDITYTNSGDAQTVTINTDGGKLTVNAPNDTVYHYGESDFVNITAVAGNSFHEFGKVGVLSVTKGRVVIEKGDNVVTTQVKGDDAIIAVPENVVLKTKLEKASDVDLVTLNVINSKGDVIAEKTFETANGYVGVDVTIPEELKKVLTSDSSETTIEPAKNYVAINGETCYDSLQAAVNVGGTVKLLNHVSLNDTLKVEKTVTINLNGYNITGEGVRAIHVKKNRLNLDGVGTVSSTVSNVGSSVIRVGDNNATSSAYLYVYKGVTISAETAYGITAFGNKNEYVRVYGTVTSTAPENTAYDGCAISTVGDDASAAKIIIFDGATVSAANTNAIYMPSGNLTVNGGTIIGRTGIYVKSGSTTISGGTIIGNGPAVAYNYYGNGGISTGDALVVDSCGYPSGVPSVTVSGGTFTSVKAKAVASYNTEENPLVTGFIEGGTFSSDPSACVVFDRKAVKEGNAWTISSVDSSAKEPYHITSESDWLYLASQASDSSGTAEKYYVVDKDLDFTGVTQKAGLRYFAGNIDFRGNTVSGLNDRNTYTYRYPSLFKYVIAGATIKNLKFELPNLGTDKTVKPIGAIEGTGTVTLENIAISGNLNMTDNNTGLLVDFIGRRYEYGPKFDGTLNLIGCTSTCNMVNNGFSSAFIGGIYHGSNQIVLNATDCVNYGKILSTGSQASMLISNGTRYSGDTLTLNIKNCRNEGRIISAPGKSSHLVMPDVGTERNFYTAEQLEAFETSGAIVNANGGISASLKAGKLAVVDGKFDLTAAMAKATSATRFELAFGFQGTGGLGGGGVTQYSFTFDSRDAVVNVPAHRWVNAADATGKLTAHNGYGTTYYTDEAGHYVYNYVGYHMNGQPEVSFVAYDASGNVMLVDFYNYGD